MHGTTTDHAPHTPGRVLHWVWLYDLLGTKMRKGRATLLQLAAPRPGEVVLDVGSGTGTLALAMAADTGAGAVTGIDPSPEMVERARRKAARSSSSVTFDVGVVEELPFADETFDLVTSSLMWHHLPNEIRGAALAEVRRVLKPGGRLVVMDFARESHSPTGHLLSLLGRGRGPATADGLLARLTDAGFGVAEVLPTRHGNLVFIRAARARR
jgi:ubiquinone/menaquinone biosynthesis C-methylase UbiE